MGGIPSGASVVNAVGAVIANPAVRHGLRIAAVIVAAIVIQRFLDRAIERIVRRTITPDRFITADAERKREDTLIRIIDGAACIIVWFVVAFVVLTELGVSTTPFVAAAGTLGLAVSIGGQHVTRDIIIGACMMLEDQYRVGDTVRINGVTGTVRDATLRLTVLCDSEGALHYFPHGLIITVVNLREYAVPPAATP